MRATKGTIAEQPRRCGPSGNTYGEKCFCRAPSRRLPQGGILEEGATKKQRVQPAAGCKWQPGRQPGVNVNQGGNRPGCQRVTSISKPATGRRSHNQDVNARLQLGGLQTKQKTESNGSRTREPLFFHACGANAAPPVKSWVPLYKHGTVMLRHLISSFYVRLPLLH